MKVFAIDQQLNLTVFSSGVAFLNECNDMGWCDPKWLKCVPTDDLRDMYDEPFEKSMIVYTDSEIIAHNMLNDEFDKLNNRSPDTRDLMNFLKGKASGDTFEIATSQYASNTTAPDHTFDFHSSSQAVRGLIKRGVITGQCNWRYYLIKVV